MIANNTLYKDKDWLFQRYWTDSLSPSQMGKLSNVTRHAIIGQMRRRGVKFRSASEARLLSLTRRPYWDKRWLYRKYKKQKVSIYGLCKLCSCCPSIIKHWLHRYSIKLRTKNEADKLKRKADLKRYYGSWWNRLLLVLRDMVTSFKKYF